MAGKKFYVVWVGRAPGVYDSWAECEAQVKGFSGAKFKSFPSKGEADRQFAGGGGASVSPTKKKQSSANKPESIHYTSQITQGGIHIYCDGACDPNPGNSGTGLAVYRNWALDKLWYGLYNPNGTNNTAELLGLMHAMHIAQDALSLSVPVTIFCDSKYAIQCITQWADSWKRRGWKRPGDQEVKNLDIIQPAHELYHQIKGDINIRHVKGHAGIEGNELADRMSMLAVKHSETELIPYQGAMDVEAILKMTRG